MIMIEEDVKDPQFGWVKKTNKVSKKDGFIFTLYSRPSPGSKTNMFRLDTTIHGVTKN